MSSAQTGDAAKADLAKRARAARLRALSRARHRAWKVAAAYGIFAVLWIYTSDRALELVTQDVELLARLSMVKGLLFVVVTAAMLLLLLRPAFEHDEERWLAEARAASEKSFSGTMIESMPGIAYFYDGQGRFLRWNRNFEVLSGYSAEEVALMHPLDFFAGEDKRLVQRRIAETFERGESSVEAAFVTRDGRTVPHYFTARRVLFEGTPCLVGVGLDITERRRAEETQLRLAAIVNSSSEAIISKTTEGIITSWNPGAGRLFGYREDEMIGRPIWTLVPPDRMDEERRILAQIALGESTRYLDTVRVRKDGVHIHVSVTVSPLFDGEGRVIGASKIARDITERKQAERVMLEMNETLESRVVERTSELQAALVRAESADRLKSAFLATMSHELRTPLNSIIGFTGILHQGLAGPLNEEQSRQLGMVRGSARHLLDVINDVLDLSKIEAGQLEIHVAPFDLPGTITRVAGSVGALAAKKNLSVEVDIAPDVKTMVSDQRRVEQILINLLGNAIKFTDHGRIKLSADLIPGGEPVGEDGSTNLRLRVADTGIGIRPEDLDVLFRPFQQLDTG
ncbi:MAG TPA: PAS domain S-box protein, partial [Thermoanaerobaculia bacterium]